MSPSTSPDDELSRTAATNDSTSDVTRLLVRRRSGKEETLDERLAAAYDSLRDIARNQLRGERAGHTLQMTDSLFRRAPAIDRAVHETPHPRPGWPGSTSRGGERLCSHSLLKGSA